MPPCLRAASADGLQIHDAEAVTYHHIYALHSCFVFPVVPRNYFVLPASMTSHNCFALPVDTVSPGCFALPADTVSPGCFVFPVGSVSHSSRLMSSDLTVALHGGCTLLQIHTFYHGIFTIFLFHGKHGLLQLPLFCQPDRLRLPLLFHCLIVGKQIKLLIYFRRFCLPLICQMTGRNCDPAHEQLWIYNPVI